MQARGLVLECKCGLHGCGCVVGAASAFLLLPPSFRFGVCVVGLPCYQYEYSYRTGTGTV
ncbi:hypothetical protein C7212DRAFT_318277 [Tuber magnatum]|uniref:Uncharacterized protein n=1 Tax=Tuber magnatum TaxID=42249 RepID=A0A317STE3_9PEZI|nr:hypothetical protein C7212DRAFT_318277 [Tuber magnatum]